MPSVANNEGKACDAVLQVLERRQRARRKNLILPIEPDYPSDRQVEIICEIGSQKVALEHTYSEPFEGFRDHRFHVPDFRDGLLSRFREALDMTVSYELTVPINQLRGRDKHAREELCDRVAQWVIDTAPTLVHDPDDRAEHIIRDPTSGIPFRLYLRRRDLMHFSPRFLVSCVAPPDAERLRRECLDKTYWRKARKLLAVKRACAAMTVLILEEDDISLTNEQLVGAAVRAVEAGREAERPDEVYLLSTCVDTWYLYPMRVGTRWHYDRAGLRHQELDPRKLANITGR